MKRNTSWFCFDSFIKCKKTTAAAPTTTTSDKAAINANTSFTIVVIKTNVEYKIIYQIKKIWKCVMKSDWDFLPSFMLCVFVVSIVVVIVVAKTGILLHMINFFFYGIEIQYNNGSCASVHFIQVLFDTWKPHAHTLAPSTCTLFIPLSVRGVKKRHRNFPC